MVGGALSANENSESIFEKRKVNVITLIHNPSKGLTTMYTAEDGSESGHSSQQSPEGAPSLRKAGTGCERVINLPCPPSPRHTKQHQST